jgi:hypothetical protein
MGNLSDNANGNTLNPQDRNWGRDPLGGAPSSFPGLFPNYNLGGVGYNEGTGMNDPVLQGGDSFVERPCRFEVTCYGGEVSIAPGTVGAASLTGEAVEPVAPLFGGNTIMPEDGDDTPSQTLQSDHTRVVLVTCGKEANIFLMTEPDWDDAVADYPGAFIVCIATFSAQHINEYTGEVVNGVPQQDSNLYTTDLVQLVCSDIVIHGSPDCAGSSSSGGSSGSSGGSSGSSGGSSRGSSGSSGSGGSGSGSGSSKDSAIVPVHWTDTGYAALYCVEAPDVRFEDTVVVERPKGARSWSYQWDGRFRSVCEEDTLEVVSCTTDKPSPVGVSVDEEALVTFNTRLLPWDRPNRMVVRLTGIRRGFLHVRFEEKTQLEFNANEKRLQLDLD